MAPSGASPAARAEDFVWLTARVLEQRRFAFHFRDGSPDAVEAALTAYRGDDGGYGHALDPDLRGPVSQPHHTVHALRVLDEIGRCGDRRAEAVCRFLTAISTPDGALPALHPASAGWPAAPWHPAAGARAGTGSLLTTGPVVGLLHRNAVWHAWLFRATDFCWAAIDALSLGGRPHPYEIEAAVAFLDGVPDRKRAEAAADRLGRVVREQRLAVLDPDRAGAGPGEGTPQNRPTAHFPHDYARSPGSRARPWFTDAEFERSLDHLAAAQQEDGGWPLRRRAWAPGTALEGRPMATIDALLTLRAHGRGASLPSPRTCADQH
ncbi:MULTISPECIES: hypothetical protein [Streptomyces]|uniref:hypothetical protein n=1 Tax=Streptomyces TaxID=1883 RepID=UPI00163CEE83|nr:MULTISPECIES: hypothetical protein [Streptomyces]MBC2876818.1 hypothetical protein [Streptomyces sp. TYQ1024]UBI36440.1 hypothetical protein K7I03_08155 [Streptomyces mobaraensis]UKW29032.1 hypothetical protein MCU78_08140 [Streptomyces sp. TYQ1024]